MSSETNVQLFPGVFRSTVGGENPGFFLHSDGRVGIGNKAPTARPLWSSDDADRNKLNVTGHTHIDGNLNVTGYLYGDGSNLSGVAAVVGGYWDLDASNNNISYSAGNVGIGGAASTNKLKVHGTVEATALSVGGTDISSTYATQTALTNGLAGKQAAGSYQASGSYASLNGDSAQDFYADRVYSDDWFRAQGNAGIYWESHGGGWQMTDSTWLRIYNGKSLWGNTGTIATNGKMGVGTSNPIAKLHINGSGSFTLGNGHTTQINAYFSQADHYSNGNWTFGGSIYASTHICTGGFIVTAIGSLTASDSRIKKEIVDVEDGSALEILRLLKPKKYKYLDKVMRGTEPVWGFIAQEVRDTLPHATQIRTECIPNIYEMANVSASNVITLTNFDTSTLHSNSMVLKVYDIENKEQLVNIAEVVDEHSVRVDEDLSEWIGSIDESGNVVAGNQLFVYGQQVDDFVFVKKDSIWTIATAALQEVDRQLQAEKEKVASLEERLAALEAIVLNQ
jgi:hypothetical protein